MEKSNMIQLIINKLQGIGIYPKVGQETDIEISKEFLDAKFSTGEKKITYKSFALFDDANKILYYYENTKEESKGFSFGVDSESSFQSGTTLFRKVKSVGYAPDGKAYEYEIDIGQITKTFKEVAKENGWKFKIVLNPKKAKYGAIIPSNSINNDNKVSNTVVANSANVSVATNEEKQPIKEATKVQNNNVINNNNKTSNNNNNDKSNKKTSTLVYIITSAIAALYLLLLDSNIIGWVITIVIFVVLILKRDFIQKMSILKKIIMWILIFIIIFFIGAFTMQNSNSNDNSNTNTSNNNSSNSNQTQNTNTNSNTSNNTSDKSNEKTPYYATAESYNILNGYEYVEGSDYKQIKPYTSASILISINNSNIEQNNNIKSIKIKNANATKSPKMGTPQFYFYDIIMENATNTSSKKHLFNGDSFEYSIEEFSKLQAIQFYYGVVDVKTQDVSSWSVIASDKALVKSGVTSDDVRSTITFEIEITDVNNKKYSRVFTQEIFSGDFLNDSTSGYISKYYNGNEILYFQEN